ncbi:hypothetical protein K8R43_02055 [archaeon]|nr:hypothetical protein [archaeon]
MPAKKKKPKKLRKQVKDVKEEIVDLSKKAEKHGKHIGKKHKHKLGWWYRTFGIIAPILSSILTLIVLMILAKCLTFFNDFFMDQVSYVINSNIHWFFIVSLIANYGKYLSEIHPKLAWIISPIFKSIGLTFIAWLFARFFIMLNALFEEGTAFGDFLFHGSQFVGSPLEGGITFFEASTLIDNNLAIIFLIFLVIFYCLSILGKGLDRILHKT